MGMTEITVRVEAFRGVKFTCTYKDFRLLSQENHKVITNTTNIVAAQTQSASGKQCACHAFLLYGSGVLTAPELR